MIDSKPVYLAVAPMPKLPRCSIAGGATETRRMTDLPPPVRTALQGAVRDRIAEAGAPFNNSDVITLDSPPRTRFLRAYHLRDLWLVWVAGRDRAYLLRAGVPGRATSRDRPGGDAASQVGQLVCRIADDRR
jgi:hypothetical protein